MYKHILVPTDGSDLSRDAASGAVRLARLIGARLTAFHVVPARPMPVLEAWMHGTAGSARRLQDLFKEHARRYLDEICDAARKAGVRCESVHVSATEIHKEIVKAARVKGCDLIYMASHGRKSASDVLLGSETIKVLTSSPIPVLVHCSPDGSGRKPSGARPARAPRAPGARAGASRRAGRARA